MKLGRFKLDYEQLSKRNIVSIEINKPKRFRVKAFWDEDFNRGYKIFKEKGVSLVEEYSWIPTLMGCIKLPDGFPQYIAEFLYELYSFEFPNGREKKDIRAISFLSKNKDFSNKEQALLLKTKAESFSRKKLELIGPAGIFCNCGLLDSDDVFVTKTFRIDSSISFNTGIKNNSFSSGSIGDINGGSYEFKKIDSHELVFKNIFN